MQAISRTSETPAPRNTPINRRGEQGGLWFRSDRYFVVGTDWYFTTRENKDIGPFDSREKASNALEVFIDCLLNQEMDVDYAASIAKDCHWSRSRFH